MMLGHAYNHTLRAHFLTQQALASILCHKVPSARFIRMACMVKDEWQMLYRTQEWLPWSTIYAKTCLVTLLPWIWKPGLVQLFYTFLLVQHFTQLECRGGWSLHLEIPRKRSHLFHASGHIRYVKLVHLYHQNRKCQDFVYIKWEYWSIM